MNGAESENCPQDALYHRSSLRNEDEALSPFQPTKAIILAPFAFKYGADTSPNGIPSLGMRPLHFGLDGQAHSNRS